jgi:hypothetical protein
MMIAAISMGPATAQVFPNAPCPAGYWHYGSLCLNNTTGDVVLASAAPEAVAEPGCRRGYWRMDSVCLNLATGDVELAEAPSQSARAGK